MEFEDGVEIDNKILFEKLDVASDLHALEKMIVILFTLLILLFLWVLIFFLDQYSFVDARKIHKTFVLPVLAGCLSGSFGIYWIVKLVVSRLLLQFARPLRQENEQLRQKRRQELRELRKSKLPK